MNHCAMPPILRKKRQWSLLGEIISKKIFTLQLLLLRKIEFAVVGFRLNQSNKLNKISIFPTFPYLFKRFQPINRFRVFTPGLSYLH